MRIKPNSPTPIEDYRPEFFIPFVLSVGWFSYSLVKTVLTSSWWWWSASFWHCVVMNICFRLTYNHWWWQSIEWREDNDNA